MSEKRKVLLIGGGGTLGTYTAEELLRLGYFVDVICLEDKKSDNEKLMFIRENATMDFLETFLKKRHYDGIVNFIHYPEVDLYKPVHKLLTQKTDHLIFLSSYRVYSDLEIPVTENTPMLLDITNDEEFLKTEKYAISKAKCEKYICSETQIKNWTIVRPVISFSKLRLDIVTCSGQKVIEQTKANKPVILPEKSRRLVAGLDWAGNTGKIIANLLFKKDAYGEAYTISSAQNLTWEEVTNYYTELIGAEFQWVDTDTYVEVDDDIKMDIWKLIYDRLFDRKVDNSKVLKVTGLKREDFLSIKEGIKRELSRDLIEL